MLKSVNYIIHSKTIKLWGLVGKSWHSHISPAKRQFILNLFPTADNTPLSNIHERNCPLSAVI